MHHPADSTSEPCQQDNAVGESILMYHSSGEETELDLIGQLYESQFGPLLSRCQLV